MRGESIESIVIVFPGALGDLLLALPALRALRARHAGARATFVVKRSLHDIVALARMADALVAVESAETVALFAGDRVPAWLEGRPRVYSWLGGDDPDVRRRLTKLTRGARFFKTERGNGALHAAVAYARSVRVPSALPALATGSTLAPSMTPAAEALLRAATGPVLALHPGAGARTKRWDVAGFVQVAHWWRAGGGTVVPIAGPAEADEPPALGVPDVRDWPLAGLAAVLSRAALYLGNDSGVSHLAGAVGASGVVLYGPSDPRRWRPLGGALVPLRARGAGPDGIPLTALPAGRVIAACRRRFALTRGDPDTSVPSYHHLSGRP